MYCDLLQFSSESLSIIWDVIVPGGGIKALSYAQAALIYAIVITFYMNYTNDSNFGSLFAIRDLFRPASFNQRPLQ